jgi:transcriptional regulator with XRE-family HTH domain
MKTKQPRKPTSYDIATGIVIRRIRERHSHTQNHLAEILGISFQQVQKYETGLNRLPLSRFVTICDYFDYNPGLITDMIKKEVNKYG